jgi:hypothetical protein
MERILHQLTAMNRAAIPQQNYRAAQMPEQGLEEPHHFFSPQGPAMKLGVQRHVLPLGRDRHGGKGINATWLVPHGAVGSLPLRCPRTFKMGNEQKPTFIQENQVRAQLSGLFLYAATDSVANGQSPLRRVDVRGARASDNSSPSHAANARGHWEDSGPETLSEFPWQSASRSTTRSGTPPLGHPPVRLGPGALSARRKDTRAAPEWVAPVSREARAVGRCRPTATRSVGRPPGSGQLLLPLGPVATGAWRAVAAALTGLLLLGVS